MHKDGSVWICQVLGVFWLKPDKKINQITPKIIQTLPKDK